jgi:hypothetical protein
MNERNLLYSGIYGAEQGRVRDRYTRAWRDRKSQHDRNLEDIADTEGWLHRRCRCIRSRPWPPPNPFQEETDVISSGWAQRLFEITATSVDDSRG